MLGRNGEMRWDNPTARECLNGWKSLMEFSQLENGDLMGFLHVYYTILMNGIMEYLNVCGLVMVESVKALLPCYSQQNSLYSCMSVL